MGVLAGILGLLYSAILQWFDQREYTKKGKRMSILFLLGFTILILVLDTVADWRDGNARIGPHFMMFFLVWLCLFFLNQSRDTLTQWSHKSARAIVQNVFAGMMLILASGVTMGWWVKESKGGPYTQEVVLKNGGELKNAVIVMMTSHHSIFYVEHHVVIVPTADVTKVVSQVKK
jgi:hypothetical protein